MILAYMISVGEVELKCDMAETYHLYITDWYDPPFPLSLSYLADLAVGLNNDSRIKLKMANWKLTVEQTILSIMADKLSILAWQNTKDGHKGKNVPESVLKKLAGLDEKQKDELETFKTVDDFQKWYERKHHG